MNFGLRLTASSSQVATYFLCVCLFSISFLVFLNAAISFVITERLGQRDGVGDAVGTLGFADELLALVACPLWGALSDRVGVTTVAVSGYAIVGTALLLVVFVSDLYPQLLLVRLLFALGGAATTTMVTAILPSMTSPKPQSTDDNADAQERGPPGSAQPTVQTSSPESAGKLAGFVGLFTGLGALIALFLLLPLPAHFEKSGWSKSNAIALSFLVVASIAGVVSCICSIGLRNLPGEEGKKLAAIFLKDAGQDLANSATLSRLRSYPSLLLEAVILGIKDVNIGLAYAGGFVARASSVAISLFIPLFVNHHFLETGRCPSNPDGNSSKESCRRAYIVASILTGVSQLVALLCAPLFGHLTSQYPRSNLPLLVAAASGVAGYAAFGVLRDPDPKGEGGSAGVYFIVALIGISQIGAIVCSLGLLAQGVQQEDIVGAGSLLEEDSEAEPLMPADLETPRQSRRGIKGSVAGIYSLSGGAGILLLTKVGGILFDKADTGSPFFIMSAFNGLLLVVGIACAVVNFRRGPKLAMDVASDQEDLQGRGN